MNGPESTSKDVADITSIIPPKLIRKNYDVFIVLKAKDNDKTKENNLIDFDADTSSKICEESSKTEEDIKKELSVIDLFENIDEVIFDPLELKNTDETLEKHDVNDKYAILRDLENAYFNIGSGAASNSVIKDIDKSRRNDYTVNESHNFDDKEDFTFPQLKLTHVADEDLIDEVLSTNIQRLAISTDKYGFNNSHYKANVFDANSGEKSKSVSNYEKINIDIPKIIRTERQYSLTPQIERNNLGAIPKNKVGVKTQMSLNLNDTISKGLDFSVTPKSSNVESKITPKITVKTDNLKHYVLPRQIFDKPQSPEEIRRHVDNLLKSKTKYCNVLKYYNPKDFYTTLNTNELEFVVESMKLDQKKYRQKRIIIEESVAATYTPGPNFDEKKTVLPQIMDRLLNKKTRMDTFANCTPKLILDCGSLRRKEIPVKLNPVVLSDDCNKERLRNLLMRQNFDHFVRAGVDRAE